jgi:hypothetical protein
MYHASSTCLFRFVFSALCTTTLIDSNAKRFMSPVRSNGEKTVMHESHSSTHGNDMQLLLIICFCLYYYFILEVLEQLSGVDSDIVRY